MSVPDFAKGASGPSEVYDVSPAGLGLSPAYLASATASASATSSSEGTAFPTSPADGDIFVYLADSTNGVKWAFQYRSGSASSYKWEFVGGPPLVSEVTTSETTTSAAYAALATAGPAVIVPLAGDFDVELGCHARADTASVQATMSYDIGGTGAVDANAVFNVQPNSGAISYVALSRLRRKTGLTAVTLTAKYKSDGVNVATFSNRWLAVTPVRVSG